MQQPLNSIETWSQVTTENLIQTCGLATTHCIKLNAMAIFNHAEISMHDVLVCLFPF